MQPPILRRLAVALVGSTLLASAATLDFVRFLYSPGAQEPVGLAGLPAVPTAVTTGPDGSIYVVGNVSSPTLPVTTNALQPTFFGGGCSGVFFPGIFPCADAFVARIAPDGEILYATYLGGTEQDSAFDIAVGAEGHAYVTGIAKLDAPFGSLNGPFVIKLSPDGAKAEVISNAAGGTAIALAPDGGIVLAGRGVPDPLSLGPPQAAPLYRAAQGDESWTPANRGLPALTFDDMAAGADGLLFAVVGGVYKSEDSGQSWRELPIGLEETPQRLEFPRTVAFHPANPSRVLVGTSGRGVLRSEDGGETWTLSSTGLAPQEGPPLVIEFAPGDPSRVYLAGPGEILFRSSDGGANWTRLTPPRTSRFVGTADIVALVIDSLQPDTVYASVTGFDFGPGADGVDAHHFASAIFVSEDAGATWLPLRYELELGPQSPFLTGPFAVDPSDRSTLYAATRTGIDVSRNRGANWEPANPPGLDEASADEQRVTAFAIDVPGAAVLAATGLGVFATTDQGRSWQPFAARSGSGFALLAVPPDQPGVAFGAWRIFTLSGPFEGQALVAKLSAVGDREWSIAFGGAGEDTVNDLAVGIDGSVWITGTTNSLDFPVVHAIQPMAPGSSSAFLAQLDASGSALTFSTYLGGSRADQGGALALGPSGSVYVAGTTSSNDFPLAAAAQSELGGDTDAFLARLRGDQSGYDFQTYLGGSQSDRGLGVALDAAGRATIAGETIPLDSSFDPPTDSTLPDLFLARFDAAGQKETALALRGTEYEFFGSLALDRTGRAILAALASGGSLQLETDTARFPVATYSGFVAAIDLDREAVRPEVTSVENGASFLDGPIAPGEILTLRGRELGPREGAVYTADSQGRLAASLSGVRVSIGELAATPLYVQSGQINVVAPVGLEIGSLADVVVETPAGRSEPLRREVTEVAPALFTLDSTGAGAAAALDERLQPISPTNPASPGSVVALYATGLGRTDPVLPDGVLTPLQFPIPVPAARTEIEINGIAAQTEWIGAAPTLPGGIVQMNVRLPEHLVPSDQHQIRLVVGGIYSRVPVTLAVR
jgi:uncharacterized protein (TIGR03437 family)